MDAQQFTRNAFLFGVDLHHNFPAEPGKNVIYSPFSIQTCLTMAFLAAGGRTAEEMTTVLKYGSNVDKKLLSEQFATFLDSINNDPSVGIANKIYVMKNYVLKPQYNALVEKHFKSTVELLNFAESAAAAKTINSWVEEKTHNRIKDLIAADMLDEDTRAVLVNAIYFKGKWTHPFDKRFTQKQPFWVTPTESVEVDMMNVKKKFRYGKLDALDATALEMTYKDSDISMLILLPNQRDGLKALEGKMSQINLTEIDQQMYSAEVELFLPKFEYEFKIELNEVLQKMGMKSAFQQGLADFSGLLESPEELYISKVIHKAFIKVDEEGAEAAAATGLTIMAMSLALPSEEVFFRAEHPFLFLLRNRKASLSLFTGMVNKF